MNRTGQWGEPGTSVGDAGLPHLDMFDPAGSDGVRTQVAALHHDGHWVAHSDLWPIVIAYDDVKALWGDARFATIGASLLEAQGITSGPLYDRSMRNLLSLEGEAHRRIRRLVSPAFTPRSVAGLRPAMRTYLERKLEHFGPIGHFELMHDIAEEYPIVIIAGIVGAPPDEWHRFSAWAEAIMKQFSFNLAVDLPEIEAALDDMEAYIAELIEARRAEPADHLLSMLVAAEDDGDRLSNRELLDLVIGLLLAGTDTTRNQLGLGMMWFARNPDQWDRLATDPGSIAPAVEEVVRFDPTASGTIRVALEDVTHRGVTFPAGSMVYLLAAGANHDPDVVTCPHAFDVSADRGSFTPLTFGTGRHYCLGANLARAELQEAFGALAPRLRNLRLDGDPVLKPFMSIYGPSELRLAFDPA
ncbi:MAG: cytochrome P450 [Actinobacteria bacterium]|nr:cytochrome P450 [Actinomycetota bacterium]